MSRTLILMPLILSLVAPSSALGLGSLEVPGESSTLSGVLFASGWRCPRNGPITIVFDDRPPLPAAVNLSRGDTAGVCGNDGRNGFLAQFNYAILGDGPHTARALDNGVEFAEADFFVVTMGTQFLSGASGSYLLSGFPDDGESVVVEWNQGVQNFLIVDYTDSGPSDCPTAGPIQDLRNDCSHILYGYENGGLVAGLLTDGDLVIICTTDGSDILCQGGPVESSTAFDLIAVSANDGPFLPLDPGSGGNIASGGQILNYTIVFDGDTFVFNGFSFFDAEPLFAERAAATSTSMKILGEVTEAFARRLATSGAASDADADDVALGRAETRRVADELSRRRAP